jgi:cytidine deaminase
MLPLLYLSAAQARTRARSYREFNVGCALLSFTSLAPEQHAYSMHVGMNVKIEKDARAHCAEPFAIVSAEAAGCTHAIGMVVVGELREEDVGICTTLHPCAQCRLFMQNSPLIRPETLIVTAHPPKDGAPGHHEVRTFKRLVEFHERLTGGRR